MNEIKNKVQFKSGYLSANGAELYYETAGEGQPLVFIHGFGLDSRMWDEQFNVFANQFHVVRYDLRGFGKSSLPTEDGYTHSDDLKALLNHLGFSNVHIIGLSMGGRVATDFALTYPEMVSSLILVDSVLHGYRYYDPDFEKIVIAAKEKGIDEARKLWIQHPLFKPAMRRPAVASQLNKIFADYSGWHWLNKNSWTPLNPPAIEQVKSIKKPVFILVGEEDLPEFHSIATILQKDISASRKDIIKNAGHMCSMEEPTVFNQVVLDFLTTF